MKKFSRRSFIPSLGAALLLPSLSSIGINEQIDASIEKATIFPKALKKGATIGLCAPAGPSHDLTEIDEFKRFLIEKGFKVKEGKFIRKHVGYFTSSDAERAEEFMQLILDDSVDAIFFTRGGWGCARILELLDYSIISQHPKILLGFSDITSLLLAITHKTGLITFHGPNGNASWNQPTWQWIEKLLCTKDLVQFEHTGMHAPNQKTIHSGTCEGLLIGGNLSVISGILGSEFFPPLDGKILFLEDVGEEPYRIDRMLTQLKLNGAFTKLNGIIIGQFKNCIAEEPAWAFTVEEVFHQHFNGLGIPIFYGAPIGHIKDKYILPIGQKVQMDADKFTITTLQSSVD
jgi:muramoyltetrapeptide carboxypeptidase